MMDSNENRVVARLLEGMETGQKLGEYGSTDAIEDGG